MRSRTRSTRRSRSTLWQTVCSGPSLAYFTAHALSTCPHPYFGFQALVKPRGRQACILQQGCASQGKACCCASLGRAGPCHSPCHSCGAGMPLVWAFCSGAGRAWRCSMEGSYAVAQTPSSVGESMSGREHSVGCLSTRRRQWRAAVALTAFVATGAGFDRRVLERQEEEERQREERRERKRERRVRGLTTALTQALACTSMLSRRNPACMRACRSW